MTRTLRGLALAALIALAGCDRTAEPGASASAGEQPAQTAAAPAASASAEPVSAAATREESTAASGAADEPAVKAASYPPRDDCAKQPGWRAFRDMLGHAVARRDGDALTALVSPEVQLDYGGGHGIDTLRRRLDDQDYRLWDKLAAILPLGCGFQGKLAALPWIFWNTPETLDPYQGMWVTGSAVPLRENPAATAAPLATLDWALVEAAPHKEANPRFLKVTLPQTGTSGYVEAGKLRSVIDYRVIAEPSGGSWRITAIIAGD